MSEVPDSVPGAQSAFPLTIFLQAEKEAARLPGTRGTKLWCPPVSPRRQCCLRWVCPQALFPRQRFTCSKCNLETPETHVSCVWLLAQGKSPARVQRRSPRSIQGRRGHWRRPLPPGWISPDKHPSFWGSYAGSQMVMRIRQALR